MKKVLVVLVLAVMLVSVCACSYVPSTRFLSRSQVNALVKEYGIPRAEVTLSYTLKDGGVEKDFEIKIIYDLLLSQTPLAVIRFIQLANEGFYDDTVLDTYHSSSPKYMILGRYAYKESAVDEGEMKFFVNKSATSDITFKGEFAQNNYREPKAGYAETKPYSLAMYHENYVDSKNTNYDTANGALMLTMDNYLNNKNYAVFAHMVSMSLKVGDGEAVTYPEGSVHPTAHANLAGFTRTDRSRSIYTDETEETKAPSFTMMDQIVTVRVKILGGDNWDKLPRVGK